jgi:tetratricopeptide (TPR) repeat protein
LETNGKITDYFYFCKGFAEYRAGDYNNSLISLSKSIELEKTNAVSYNERGSVFCSMGLFREALADFTKAVEIDGENAGYHYNRGLAFYKIRNYK